MYSARTDYKPPPLQLLTTMDVSRSAAGALPLLETPPRCDFLLLPPFCRKPPASIAASSRCICRCLAILGDGEGQCPLCPPIPTYAFVTCCRVCTPAVSCIDTLCQRLSLASCCMLSRLESVRGEKSLGRVLFQTARTGDLRQVAGCVCHLWFAGLGT